MGGAVKRPTRAIFWDIDGTLLVTGRAGLIAWEQALLQHTGNQSLTEFRLDGLTDHQIAATFLGHPAADDAPGAEVQTAVAALVARYVAALAGALPMRQGRVLDNVAAVLDRLAQDGHTRLSWLVTGNTHGGGAAKLAHYGLADYFRAPESSREGEGRLDGAFSVRVEPRARIVRRALELAQERVPGLTASEVLVIGDTPHDIEGARAIGIPVLAVATNTHPLEELAAHGPWRALPRLPEPDAFEALLREADEAP